MLKLFKELVEHKNALVTLVVVNLKTSVFATRLGVIWWIADPIIMMSIYYFMVRIIFNRGGENYHLFALCGIVAWQFFSRAVKSGSRSFTGNKSLLQQIGIPISVLIAIPILVQLFFAVIGFSIVLAWSHPTLSVHAFSIVPLVALIALIAYGLCIYLSMCEVMFKDTNQIVGYVLRLGFFLTPILYSGSRITDRESVPEFIKMAFQMNPFAWIIPSIRTAVLDESPIDWQIYFLIAAITLVLIHVGLIVLRRQTPRLAKMI